MGHELILTKDGKRQNITQLIGNLAWSSNVEALGVEMSFQYAYNDTLYFNKFDILNIGDQIVMFNEGKVLNYFIIVKEGEAGRFGKSYTCFDRAWYLNKNETIIQFKKLSANKAIEKLLDKFIIKHKIASMPTLIRKIYKDITVSDIILDILTQVEQETGIKYRMEMKKDILTISKMTDLIINPKIRLPSNTNPIPVTATISNPSKERSIEDMKNKVIVVTSDDKSTKVYAQKDDTKSISHYGLLTEVVTLDSKNAAQARNIAANTLKELNRVNETVSCEMLGDDDIRAGRILEMNEPITGIVGKYLIKSASHTVNNDIHKVSVELGAV
ncbi:hypothetical protein [Cohnella sp. WQ 127256]|uniref:XkdQ/YqbQ family protein n=1 Tax=Cohnella sp. WQ 127256 TaxID=2938790 RepID=UPI002118A518|nr:hypothetical protein [Cohnella sp. WQ 127256]